MGSLAGKRILVTGGGRGIGRAIVSLYHKEGAEIITCGRSERPDDLPGDIDWQQMDVSRRQDVDDLYQEILSSWGALDVLVNNAGVQLEKTILDTSDDDWDQVMGVNAKGVFMMCRAFIAQITQSESGTGSIINIGSISGKVADPSLALYNASKAFVHGLTRSIAVDHGPDVRCNAICPGWIMTEMAEAAFELCDDPKAAQTDALKRHAAGRFGKPEDIAALALWLASDQSSFATGQCYTLDGGLTAASPLNTGLF